MLKHVYRVFVFIAVFAAAVFFMGKNMKEVRVDVNATVTMGEATFPVVYLQTGDFTMNELHGYSSNLEANVVREAMTPLGIDKTFNVIINENESNVKKLKYEVRKIENNELVDSGAISALSRTNNGKSAEIKIKEYLETSKEYAVRLTVITDTSKKINYYTRIKYYEEDYYLKEKMDFVTHFHKSILDKKKAEDITKYLEPHNSEANDSLSRVTIHSNFELISWGNLKPSILTEVVPTIKEFNIETAAIELSYFASAETSLGPEVFQVKEFYRVRFTSDRIYLLKYERTMEELFNINMASITKSEIRIGITNESDMEIVTSKDSNKLCFVRKGSLWFYNLPENKLVKVFSFLKDNVEYIRNGYDQHNIRILNMDESGNIDFLVYGYMNRGDYEGKVAIVLYKYHVDENRIEEQVYTPLETTFQMLKEDLNNFSYVNKKGIFYFTIHNQVYSYNIIAKKLTVVAENINENNFIMVKESKSIAWLDSENPKKASSITILNLETEQQQVIKANAKDTIRILGAVDENIIYGFARTSDIFDTTDGTTVIPVYQLIIADMEGNILKEYKKKNVYITKVEVSDNVIKLNRIRKNPDSEVYSQAEPDSILTKVRNIKKTINFYFRNDEDNYKVAYLKLPENFTMEAIPSIVETKNTIITEDTTLHLGGRDGTSTKYYVYALGSIKGSYLNPAEAILKADELMGVVISSNNQIVWERGGKFNRKTIGGISTITTGNGIDSIGACISMLLKYNLVTKDAKALSGSNQSIYHILKENIDHPINLAECTLDQVLYFVSSGRPVIAMKDSQKAVLIIGYDENYITIIDPSSGSSNRMYITNADRMFREAGYIFVSYLN